MFHLLQCGTCVTTSRLIANIIKCDLFSLIMKCLLIILILVKTGKSCSYVSLFDYRYATRKDEYKYKYDEIKIENTRLPEEAKEEAIMLIGGMNWRCVYI